MSNRKLFERVNPTVIDSAGFTAPSITPKTTIKDRRAGSSATLDTFGPELNLEFIGHHLKNSGVRKLVAKFFLNGSAAIVFDKAISTAVLRSGDAVAQRDAIIAATIGIESDSHAQAVINSYLVYIAYQSGIINERTPIRNVITYGRNTVTISKLTLDLISQAAHYAASKINVKNVGGEKMSRTVFAQAIAELLQPIGFELHRSVSIQRILTDIVVGIRARIDTLSGIDHSASIPVEWIEHPVVVELSTNAVFLRAALEMKSTASLGLKNDLFTLTREAPVALAELKQSTRYAICSADEYLSTFGKVTITDVSGAPRYFVGWRDAKLEPVAQNVSVFTDALYPSKARLVLPGPDSASKLVATAMPQRKHASINTHISEYLSMLQHLTETRDPRLFASDTSAFGKNMGEVYLMGDDGMDFDTDLCWFLADEIYLDRDDTSETGYSVSYMVKPDYKVMPNLNYEAALTPAGEFVTDSQAMVFLMCKDFAPKAMIEARSQLFSEKAMHSRVFDLDESRLIDADARVSFNFSIGNSKFTGSIKRKEIGMPDMPSEARFVKPIHNEYVAKVIDLVYGAKFSLAQSAKDLSSTPILDEEGVEVGLDGATLVPSGLASFLEQYAVKTVLDMAQEIGVQYRDLVTSLFRVRSMATLSGEELVTAKGYIQQGQFLALSDLASLNILFGTLGLKADAVDLAQKSPSLSNVIMAHGSDRQKNK